MNSKSMPGHDGPSSDLRSRTAPVIDRAPLPMVEVEGTDHLVCFVNAAFCRLLQKEREELIGKSFAEIVCNGPECVKMLKRVYATGEPVTHAELDNSGADAAFWLFAMWPALDAEEKPERVIIQLTKSVQFRQNSAAMNEALLIGALRQHELREEAEASNARLEIEILERTRAEASLLEARAKLIADADKLEHTVAERTAQLRASIGDLEAFSYSLVHDLRAPVRAIHGFTQLALEMPENEVGPSAAQLLNRVVKAAVRMDSLIQDVLSLSEVARRPIVVEPIDVEALIKALIEERPELAPIRADIGVESPLLRMLGHEASLSQCLTNLLGNAVKFVEPGMRPRIRVWTQELASVSTREIEGAGTHGSTVRLWVEDQGIGIAPEFCATIFEIFQRLDSKYDGSGIGLAIVRKAMERMGGRVGVESERGEGCRFWLELSKA